MFEPSTRQSRLDAKTAAAARFLIFPTGTFRTCWDIMLVFLVVYNAFSLPFVVCFEVEQASGLVVLDQIIDAIFYVDLLLNFLTTYEVKGHLVLDVKTVVWHYLTNWFLVDLIATFPFEVVTGSGYGESHQFKVSLLRGLKCVRLIRLARLFKFLEKIEFVNGFLKMLRLFFGFSIVAHWLACLWYLIGRLSLTWDSTTPQGWMVFYNSTGWDVYQKTHVSSYITSLYWTITTLLTVGYGDISAHTNLEKMFAVLTMVFGALISATIFGNVTMLIESLGRSEAMYREKMEAVQYYMNDLDLPDTMQHRIRDFYTLLWNRNKSFGGENILAELPPSFHHEIAGFLNQDLFDKSMIFIDGDPYFLRNLASRLKFCVSLPNDDIIREEEPSDKIYFIRKGSVQVTSEAAGKLTVMKEGNYFGEIGLMMKEFYEEFGLGDNKASVPFIPSLDADGQEINKKEAAAAATASTTVPNKRTASVMALVNCDLYFLTEDDFYGLIDHYPQYHRLFLLIALVRFKQIDYHDDEDIIQKIFITQVRRKELRLKYHRKEKPKKQSIIATKKGGKAKSVPEAENVDAAPLVDTFEETTKELIRRVSLIGLDAETQAALKLKHAALGFVARASTVEATPKADTNPASPSGTIATMPAIALPPSAVPVPTPSPSSTSASSSSSTSASDSAATTTATATAAGISTSTSAAASSLAEGLTKDDNEPGSAAQKIPPKPDAAAVPTVAEIHATSAAVEVVPLISVDNTAVPTAQPASVSEASSSPTSPSSPSAAPASPSGGAPKTPLIRARSFELLPLLREETDEEDESSRSAAAGGVAGPRTPSVVSPLGSPRKQQTGNNTPVATPSTPRDRAATTVASAPSSAGSSTASSPQSTTQSTPVLAPAPKPTSAIVTVPSTTASSSSSVDEIKASPRAPATAVRETRRVPIPSNLVTAATSQSSASATSVSVDKSIPARIIANLPSAIVPSAAVTRIMGSSASSAASSTASSPKIGSVSDSPKPQAVPYPFSPSSSSASPPPVGRAVSTPTTAATSTSAAASIPTPTASSRPAVIATPPVASVPAAALSPVRTHVLSNAVASAAGTSSQPRSTGPIRPAIIEAVSKTDPEFASLLQRASALASTSPSSAKYVNAAAQSSAARAATSPVRSPTTRLVGASTASPVAPIPVPSMAPPPPPAATPPAPASIAGVDDPMLLSRHSLSSSSHRSEGQKRTTPSLSREPSGGPGAPSISRSSSTSSSSTGTIPGQRGSHSTKSEPDARGSSDESDEGAPTVGVQAATSAATSSSARSSVTGPKTAAVVPPATSTPSPIPPYSPAVQQMTAVSSSQLQSPGRSQASPLSAREGLRQFLNGGPSSSAASSSSSAFTRYALSPPPPPIGTSSSSASAQARSPLSPAFQSPVRSPPPASSSASPSSLIASTPPPAVKPWIQFLNRPSPASTASRSATVTPARPTIHPMPGSPATSGSTAAASSSTSSSSTGSSSSSSADSTKLFTPRKPADQK